MYPFPYNVMKRIIPMPRALFITPVVADEMMMFTHWFHLALIGSQSFQLYTKRRQIKV